MVSNPILVLLWKSSRTNSYNGNNNNDSKHQSWQQPKLIQVLGLCVNWKVIPWIFISLEDPSCHSDLRHLNVNSSERPSLTTQNPPSHQSTLLLSAILPSICLPAYLLHVFSLHYNVSTMKQGPRLQRLPLYPQCLQ